MDRADLQTLRRKYQESAVILSNIVSNFDSVDPKYSYLHFVAMQSLSSATMMQANGNLENNLEKAEKLLSKAINAFEEILEPEEARLHVSRFHLITLCRLQRKYVEAEEQWRQLLYRS